MLNIVFLAVRTFAACTQAASDVNAHPAKLQMVCGADRELVFNRALIAQLQVSAGYTERPFVCENIEKESRTRTTEKSWQRNIKLHNSKKNS